MAEEPELLTLAEAGEVLRVHRLVVGKLVRAGRLPAVRGERGEWLLRRPDLDAFLLSAPYQPGSTRLGRRGTQPDGREWLDALTAAGWSDAQICKSVGMRPETLARSRVRGVGMTHRRRVRELAEDASRRTVASRTHQD